VKVVLYSPDEMMADIMALALEGVSSASVELVDSAASAAEFVRTRDEIDLIVIDSDEDSNEAIVQARKKKIPLIRITSAQGQLRPSGIEGEFLLVKPLDVRNFLELAMQSKKKEDQSELDGQYCRVRLDTLLLIGNQFEFDVYIRINESRYLKVVHKGDSFDSEKYSHFMNKGLQFLHVPKEGFLVYLNNMSQALHSALQSPSLSVSDGAQLAGKVYESAREGMVSIGITEETQRVMKLTVDLAVRSIEKNPTLRELLNELLKNNDSFQSWHSVALSFISCKLSSLMTWDSQNTHFKLSLAAMVHDITLPEPGWARFETRDDAERAGLTPEQMEKFLNHPKDAAALVKKLTDFPGDVDFIVAQHQELPDGTGFPEGLNHNKIAPLSCLFIVAHDLCHRLYYEKNEFDFARFLREFDQKYPVGYFRKIRQQLEKIDPKELNPP
jgi:hypothetical protein